MRVLERQTSVETKTSIFFFFFFLPLLGSSVDPGGSFTSSKEEGQG